MRFNAVARYGSYEKSRGGYDYEDIEVARLLKAGQFLPPRLLRSQPVSCKAATKELLREDTR